MLKRFFSFFAKKLFDTKNAIDAPMEAEMKTIIDPKYEPYKKPDNRDNQEAGSINKTIKIYMQTNEKTPISVLKKKDKL